MSCRLRKGLTRPIDRTSVEVKEGEPSLLWGQLFDFFTDETGRTNVSQAFKSYIITQKEEFKTWFKISKSSTTHCLGYSYH